MYGFHVYFEHGVRVAISIEWQRPTETHPNQTSRRSEDVALLTIADGNIVGGRANHHGQADCGENGESHFEEASFRKCIEFTIADNTFRDELIPAVRVTPLFILRFGAAGAVIAGSVAHFVEIMSTNRKDLPPLSRIEPS